MISWSRGREVVGKLDRGDLRKKVRAQSQIVPRVQVDVHLRRKRRKTDLEKKLKLSRSSFRLFKIAVKSALGRNARGKIDSQK